MAEVYVFNHRLVFLTMFKKAGAAFLLLSLLAVPQCRTRKSEIYQFSFDRDRAMEISLKALTEFARMNTSAVLGDYVLNDPFMSSLYARTPSGKTEKVVLVCFPHKTAKDNWAQAHLSVKPGGGFKLLSVGFRIQRFEEMLEAIRDPAKNDLWGGGL